MTKEELQLIRDIMREELTAQEGRIMEKLSVIEEDVSGLKESMEEVRSAANYTASWVEKLQDKVSDHDIQLKAIN